MHIEFDDLLSDDELRIVRTAQFGRESGFGSRPAVLVIDAQNYMVGDGHGATEQYPSACGDRGEEALRVLAPVLTAARAAGAPVIFTRFVLRGDGADIGQYGRKRPFKQLDGYAIDGTIGAELSPLVEVLPQDFVLVKAKPSAYFGTPLLSLLIQNDVDTVLIAGGSTSNCVRATTVDAFSYNYRPVVLQDCVFDRFDISHRTTLFDLDRQYADVRKCVDVLSYLESLKQ